MKFCWVTLNVKDMEKSLEFYQHVVGLSVHRTMDPMPGTTIAFLGFAEGDTEVELIRNEKNNAPEYGKDISLGFEVESVDRQVELLKTQGVTDILGPFEPSPVIKFIYVVDPNGVKIQFVEHRHP